MERDFSVHAAAIDAGRAGVLLSGGPVAWLLMREVMLLASTGVAIRLAGAFGATRLAQTQLFGVLPTDTVAMVLRSLGIAGSRRWLGICRRAGRRRSIR